MQLFSCCQWPGSSYRQWAHHGQPHRCSQSVVLFPHDTAPAIQTFLDVGRDAADTHPGFCRLDYCNSVLTAVNSRLLQKYRWYRTLLPDSSQELGDVITWPRFYVNFTGCQCDKESGLKLVYKCIHVLAPSYPGLVGPICDPPRLAKTFLFNCWLSAFDVFCSNFVLYKMSLVNKKILKFGLRGDEG